MKLMDSAAGIVAARHCLTNVVTISVEEMDFLAPVYNGYVVFITADIVFTSAKYDSLLQTCERKKSLKLTTG